MARIVRRRGVEVPVPDGVIDAIGGAVPWPVAGNLQDAVEKCVAVAENVVVELHRAGFEIIRRPSL